MKFTLIFLLLISNINFYKEHQSVITLPNGLIFDEIENCLRPYGINNQEFSKFKNTFICTEEFIKRIQINCDPKIFEFYAIDFLELWEIDLKVSEYYDSLRINTPNIQLLDNSENSTDSSTEIYRELSETYLDLSNEKRGKLKIIDYSNINLNETSNLEKHLRQKGLDPDETNQIIKFIKNKRP